MRLFIEAIIRAFQGNPELHLRILITSQVEEHIQGTLETSVASSVVHRLSLQDIDARDDIRAFLQSRLFFVRQKKHHFMQTDHQWPSMQDLNSLIEKSQGSFLVAKTLISLIDARGHPEDNLRKALTAEGGLDKLYTQVLANAPRDNAFWHIIGTIISIPTFFLNLIEMLF